MATSQNLDSANTPEPREKKGFFSRKPKTPKVKKGPGRFKQMIQVYKMTHKHDPMVTWLMILVFLGVVVLFTGGALLLTALGQTWANWPTALILGIAFGLLGAMIILGRRAERAAFAQIEGQPGAAGAALNSIKRGWIVEEQPVAVNPRSQDCVFRAIGRPGVVLITEGPSTRVRSLLDAERRRLARILPNVTIHVVESGKGEGQIELHNLNRTLNKMKPEITKAEVQAVNKRISSLGTRLPIPKGIDPYKARPDRKASKGR